MCLENLDPIPVNYLTVPEAVEQLTAITTDIHIANARRAFERLCATVGVSLPETPPPVNSFPPDPKAILEWQRRELAIQNLHSALLSGALRACVRDPVSGVLFRLEPRDWATVAFWYQTIRGGTVCSSTGEAIERHEGRRLLIERISLSEYLVSVTRRRPASNCAECRTWLEAEMKAHPLKTNKTKNQWFYIAKSKFGVRKHEFQIAWNSANKLSGASWHQPGRPKGPHR